MQLSLTFPTTELQGAFPANAETLFKFLDINSKYADWIKNRITQYGFIKNQDYIIQTTYTGRRPRKEYFITLNMAKELCMAENNERGKEARCYFIECEKHLKNLEQEQMQKLAFKQSLGYKSQLKQQKEKYENKIKALKYDLDKLKKTQNFKRKLNHKELQELKKFLAKEYDIFTLNKCFFGLFAESVSRKNYTLDKENGFCIYKSIEEKFNSWLDYDKHYDENEKGIKLESEFSL